MPVLEKLGASATSDDESDHEDGERRFRIVVPSWRSADLTKWLRVYDSIYSSTKFNYAGRPSRDNWTRIRVPPHLGAPESQKKPPAGLPRNFFKPGYLDSLLRYERDALCVEEEVYPLQHTEEIMA